MAYVPNRLHFFSIYRETTFLSDKIAEELSKKFEIVYKTSIGFSEKSAGVMGNLEFEKVERIKSFVNFATVLDSDVDYHILCDDDVVFSKDSLTEDIEFLNRNNSVLLLQPSHNVQWHWNYPTLLNKINPENKYQVLNSLEIGPFLIIRAGFLLKLFPNCFKNLGYGLEKYWTLFPSNSFCLSHITEICHVRRTGTISSSPESDQTMNRTINRIIGNEICQII
jgi:hypothetical protein